jgi:hypothetical protein
MVAILRTVAGLATLALLIACFGCGSSEPEPSVGTAAREPTGNKKPAQKMNMQLNPNFKPMQQGSKLTQ